MRIFSSTYDIAKRVYNNRRLLFEMTKRDLSDRYAGQVLGTVWAVIHPVLTISVFIVLFGVIFRVKASSLGVGNVPHDHTLYMLSGLIPWLVASDILGRTPSLIIGQAALVKQVVFPLEILPVKTVLATLPMFTICLLGLLVYTFITRGSLPWSFVGVIPAAFIMYIALLGMAFFLSTLGVLLRDTKDLVSMYLLVGLYMAPVFYYMDWVPSGLRVIIYFNPATWFINCFHDVFYYGLIPDWTSWATAAGISIVSLLTGCFFFNRFKNQFGNFL